MNLARMRTLLQQGLADRASDFDLTELDEALNTVHQFQLPNRVDGSFRESTIVFQTQVGKDTYDMDSADLGVWEGRIRSIGLGLRLDTAREPLQYFDRADLFWEKYIHSDATQNPPTGYLVIDREIILRPIPNAVVTLISPATTYRAALTVDGIMNEEQARTTVAGAIVNLANDNNWDGLLQKWDGTFQSGVAALTIAQRGRHRTRPRRKDF